MQPASLAVNVTGNHKVWVFSSSGALTALGADRGGMLAVVTPSLIHPGLCLEMTDARMGEWHKTVT